MAPQYTLDFVTPKYGMGFLQKLLKEQQVSQLNPHPWGVTNPYATHPKGANSARVVPRRVPLIKRPLRTPRGHELATQARGIYSPADTSPSGLPEEFPPEAEPLESSRSCPSGSCMGPHPSGQKTTVSLESETHLRQTPSPMIPLGLHRRIELYQGSFLRNSRSCSRLGLTAGASRSSLGLKGPLARRSGSSFSRLSLVSCSADVRPFSAASAAPPGTHDADTTAADELADVAELLQRVRRASLKLQHDIVYNPGRSERAAAVRPIESASFKSLTGVRQGKYSQSLKRSPYGSFEGPRLYTRRSSNCSSFQQRQLPRVASLPYHPMLTEAGLVAASGEGPRQEAFVRHAKLAYECRYPVPSSQRQSREGTQHPPWTPPQSLQKDKVSRPCASAPPLPRQQFPAHASLQEKGQNPHQRQQEQQQQRTQQKRVSMSTAHALGFPKGPKSETQETWKGVTQAQLQLQRQKQQILDGPKMTSKETPGGTPKDGHEMGSCREPEEGEEHLLSFASLLSSDGAGSALEQLLCSSSSATISPAGDCTAASSLPSRRTSPRAFRTFEVSEKATEGSMEAKKKAEKKQKEQQLQLNENPENSKSFQSRETLESSEDAIAANVEEAAACTLLEDPMPEDPLEYVCLADSLRGPLSDPPEAADSSGVSPSVAPNSVASWEGRLPQYGAERDAHEEWSRSSSERHSMHEVRLQLSCLHQEVLSMWHQKEIDTQQQQQQQQHPMRGPSKGGQEGTHQQGNPCATASDPWKKHRRPLLREHLQLCAAPTAACSKSRWNEAASLVSSAADRELPFSARAVLRKICSEDLHSSKQQQPQQPTPFLLPYGQGHTAERARWRLQKKVRGGHDGQQQQQQQQQQEQQQQQRDLAAAEASSSFDEAPEGSLDIQGAAQQLQELQQQLQSARSMEGVLEEKDFPAGSQRAARSPAARGTTDRPRISQHHKATTLLSSTGGAAFDSRKKQSNQESCPTLPVGARHSSWEKRDEQFSETPRGTPKASSSSSSSSSNSSTDMSFADALLLIDSLVALTQKQQRQQQQQESTLELQRVVGEGPPGGDSIAEKPADAPEAQRPANAALEAALRYPKKALELKGAGASLAAVFPDPRNQGPSASAAEVVGRHARTSIGNPSYCRSGRASARKDGKLVNPSASKPHKPNGGSSSSSAVENVTWGSLQATPFSCGSYAEALPSAAEGLLGAALSCTSLASSDSPNSRASGRRDRDKDRDRDRNKDRDRDRDADRVYPQRTFGPAQLLGRALPPMLPVVMPFQQEAPASGALFPEVPRTTDCILLEGGAKQDEVLRKEKQTDTSTLAEYNIVGAAAVISALIGENWGADSLLRNSPNTKDNECERMQHRKQRLLRQHMRISMALSGLEAAVAAAEAVAAVWHTGPEEPSGGPSHCELAKVAPQRGWCSALWGGAEEAALLAAPHLLPHNSSKPAARGRRPRRRRRRDASRSCSSKRLPASTKVHASDPHSWSPAVQKAGVATSAASFTETAMASTSSSHLSPQKPENLSSFQHQPPNVRSSSSSNSSSSNSRSSVSRRSRKSSSSSSPSSGGSASSSSPTSTARQTSSHQPTSPSNTTKRYSHISSRSRSSRSKSRSVKEIASAPRSSLTARAGAANCCGESAADEAADLAVAQWVNAKGISLDLLAKEGVASSSLAGRSPKRKLQLLLQQSAYTDAVRDGAADESESGTEESSSSSSSSSSRGSSTNSSRDSRDTKGSRGSSAASFKSPQVPAEPQEIAESPASCYSSASSCRPTSLCSSEDGRGRSASSSKSKASCMQSVHSSPVAAADVEELLQHSSAEEQQEDASAGGDVSQQQKPAACKFQDPPERPRSLIKGLRHLESLLDTQKQPGGRKEAWGYSLSTGCLRAPQLLRHAEAGVWKRLRRFTMRDKTHAECMEQFRRRMGLAPFRRVFCVETSKHKKGLSPACGSGAAAGASAGAAQATSAPTGNEQPESLQQGKLTVESCVLSALRDLGWAGNTNLNSLFFDLKWRIRATERDYRELRPQQLLNHFEGNEALTTKGGLTRTLQQLRISEGVATDAFYPRAYDLGVLSDCTAFLLDCCRCEALQLLLLYIQQVQPCTKLHTAVALAPQAAEQRCSSAAAQAASKSCSKIKNCPSLRHLPPAAPVAASCYRREALLLPWLALAILEAWLPELDPEAFLDFRDGRSPEALSPAHVEAFVEHSWLFRRHPKAFLSHWSSLNQLLQRQQQLRSLEMPPFSQFGELAGQLRGPHYEEVRRLLRRIRSLWSLWQQDVGSNPHTDALLGLADQQHHQHFKPSEDEQDQWPIRNIWIVKPCSNARASGIKLFTSPLDILRSGRGLRDRLAQRYIERPLLLWGRRKFDLRVWVLVRSFCPLKLYLYSEVYIRLCSEPYDLKNLSNNFSHISNWSLNRLKAAWRGASQVGKIPPGQAQKRTSSQKGGLFEPSGGRPEAPQDAAGPPQPMNPAGAATEDKRKATNAEGDNLAGETTLPLQCLRAALAEKTGNADYWGEVLLPQLRYLVLQTMRGGRHSVVQRSNCFELYGLDVLLDEALRPWLLEVNLSPACSSREPWLHSLLKRMTEQLLEIVLKGFLSPSAEKQAQRLPSHKANKCRGREGAQLTAATTFGLEGWAKEKTQESGHWELLFDETLPLEKAVSVLPIIAAPTQQSPTGRQSQQAKRLFSRKLIQELYAGGGPAAAASAASCARRCVPRMQGLSVQGTRITHALHRFAVAFPLQQQHTLNVTKSLFPQQAPYWQELHAVPAQHAGSSQPSCCL